MANVWASMVNDRLDHHKEHEQLSLESSADIAIHDFLLKNHILSLREDTSETEG